MVRWRRGNAVGIASGHQGRKNFFALLSIDIHFSLVGERFGETRKKIGRRLFHFFADLDGRKEDGWREKLIRSPSGKKGRE